MLQSFHHVGCLVPDIDRAIADYTVLYPDGRVSEMYDITEQQVKVCFFSIPGAEIEFVAPYGGQSFLYRLLEKTPGFYHIGVFTSDIDAELARLEAGGYRKINEFRSPAFGNRRCSFLLNQERHMIELIEGASVD